MRTATPVTSTATLPDMRSQLKFLQAAIQSGNQFANTPCKGLYCSVKYARLLESTVTGVPFAAVGHHRSLGQFANAGMYLDGSERRTLRSARKAKLRDTGIA
jgi:hypothetical protein